MIFAKIITKTLSLSTISKYIRVIKSLLYHLILALKMLYIKDIAILSKYSLSSCLDYP